MKEKEKDIVFDALYRLYLSKLRKRYLRKKIEAKNKDLVEKRREINREIRKLKETLKNCEEEQLIKIVKELRLKENELKKINEKIESNSKFEMELYKEISEIEKGLKRQIDNYFKGLIFKEQIEKPIDLAIQQKRKDIALRGLIVELELPDEGEKPEGSNYSQSSPNKGEVKISPSGAVRGVGGFFKIF